MSPPTTRFNTFMQNTNKHLLDRVSKIFIFTEIIFGLNRISLAKNVKNWYHLVALGYTFVVNCIILSRIIYLIFFSSPFIYLYLVDSFEVLLNNILNILLRKRLCNFYNELNKFDEAIGFKEKITRSSVQNLIQMSITFTINMFLILIPVLLNGKGVNIPVFLILTTKIYQFLELHYFAHLIGMIAPRIRMITNYIKVSYPPREHHKEYTLNYESDFVSFKESPRKYSRLEMDVTMDLYHNIIVTYDYLNEAITWQMLVFLMMSFTVSLGGLHDLSMTLLSGNYEIGWTLVTISFTLLQLTPIFTTCVFGDQVCKEVGQLREILTSCLYENTLDKPSRTAANAFVALTEVRDLSFSLFHMFIIDITFPFKFLGLLLTYLIILLQFDKVIHPNNF